MMQAIPVSCVLIDGDDADPEEGGEVGAENALSAHLLLDVENAKVVRDGEICHDHNMDGGNG